MMDNIILSLKMKGFIFFTIIYIVNSVQITSFATFTSIPINKVYPSPSYKPSVKFVVTASSKPSVSASVSASLSASVPASVFASLKVYKSGSSTAHPSASHNTTIYKIKLTDNQKIITIENQKIENKKIENKKIENKKIENKKIDVNIDIKKYEEKKSKINYKFLIIFFVFIIMIFGYSIYKCIYIIKNTKPKKVENGLPFYNNNYIDVTDNNIYHLQPHSPKNQEQCYRRISSNSSMSNMESF